MSIAAKRLADDRAHGITSHAKARVLVVDDVFDNREILSRQLKRRDFETVEACDGIEALRLIEASTFDVVLLDVLMPVMTGLEVLQKIRLRYSAGQLPVIMVTARAMAEDVVEALAFGANDYVTKPVDLPVVLARVNTQVERRRADAKSAYLAFHDALTGLLNRHGYDEQLPALLQSARLTGRGLAVLLVDLDGFKDVNDAFGHAFGDMLIKSIVVDLQDAVDGSDVLVRLGGDEVAVIHTSNDVSRTADELAARLIELIGRGRTIDQQQIFVSASIGITVADGSSNSTEMLRRADLSMYDAKASGRGTWRPFKPEMDAQRRERHALESELRLALHRGELDLHFQPIVNLAEGRTSGFEALLRWHRGAGGAVPPDKFIPLAEETGLIIPIGDWVLRRACEEATTWPADVRVAVNVSAKQFHQQHILRSLITALAATGLPPERLELELTETVLLHGNDDNLKVLNECRRLGVRLSMDDFGTGYSSLAYFRLFQFDNVKIDRSFVAGYRNEREGGAVIRAVVGLAGAFEFATIAEGVETEDQLTYLRSIGCHEAQGFLLGRPRPGAQIHDSMRRPTVPTLTTLGTPA